VTKQKVKAAPPPEIQITEAELKQQLVGKPLYLRGGYLDNTLSFNELGALIGASPRGSYTLSGIQIQKLHLGKHKLELEGARYGVHFLGTAPDEDPTNASVERVNITPKKKKVKITIDREVVVASKLGLHGKREKHADKNAGGGVPAKSGPAATAQDSPDDLSDAGQMKAQFAAAPPEERPADPVSVTATTSPSHATKVLKDALDRIFALGIDDRLKASMPAFWKLYYQTAAANTGFRPSDPAVLRQNMVDKKAKLITAFEPQSNEYAQAHAVIGMALYHTVIGADGKPAEIAVGRPIGFGLDENAVESIRKASFEPAIKDGRPVPVLLDLVVQFRIYSDRTATKSEADKPAESKPDEPILPGPYSVQHP
jgi:outer membrane biosynthesis protein TonB